MRLTTPAFLVGLCLLIQGCDSSGSSSTGSSSGGSSSPAFAAAPPPQDAAISLADTYVTATVSIDMDARVETTTPMYNATTGQESQIMLLDGATVRYAIEAGYNSAGAFVFNQYALDPYGNPQTEIVDEARRISVHDGRLELYGPQGQALAGTTPGNGPSLRTMFDEYGTTQLETLSGLLLDQVPNVGEVASRGGATETITDVTYGRNNFTVSASVAPVGGGAAIPQSRTYVNNSGTYVLAEVRTGVNSTNGNTQITGESVVVFENVNWRRNATQDQLRASGTANTTWGEDPAARTPPYNPPCDLAADPECVPMSSGGGSGTPPPSGPPCPTTTGGANIVYQHGILSNGETWGTTWPDSGVRGRVRCEFVIGNDIAPSQADLGLRAHVTQAEYLREQVDHMGPGGTALDQNIFIGHSQGGLISRRVAQGFVAEGHAERVRGLITIGTPHAGAHLFRNVPTNGLEAAQAIMIGTAACRVIAPCTRVHQGLGLLNNGILALAGTVNAVRDLKPGSIALGEVNLPTETFPRYGIQHYPSKRWAFARVAGDLLVTNGGPGFVTAMDIAFYGSTGAAIISFICGWWGLGAALIAVAARLKQADIWWNNATAGSDRSDGIVQGTSQVYPNAMANISARTPTSHAGETNTERSYIEVRDVLIQQMGVVQR